MREYNNDNNIRGIDIGMHITHYQHQCTSTGNEIGDDNKTMS